jgi:ATP-dependent Clp protease ATP-binding subunit ClpA
MLDDGHITDNQGRTINTKETIIVLTSNLGSQIILEAPVINQEIENNVYSIVKKIIRPELINRLDSIILFNRLDQKTIELITQKKLKEFQTMLLDQHINLTYTQEAITWLAIHGYDIELGARPLERLIKKREFGQNDDRFLN